MSDRTPLHPFGRVTFEISYPFRYRYTDTIGRLIEELDEFLGEDVSFVGEPTDDLVFAKGERAVAGISPLRTWVSPDLPLEEVERAGPELAHGVWDIVQSVLEPRRIDGMSCATSSVLAWDTVEEAVHSFRKTFFDYTAEPLEALGGTPKKVFIVLESDGIAQIGSQQADGRLRLLPVRVTDELAKDFEIDPSKWGGGWLIDLRTSITNPSLDEQTTVMSSIFAENKRCLEQLTTRLGLEEHALGA